MFNWTNRQNYVKDDSSKHKYMIVSVLESKCFVNEAVIVNVFHAIEFSVLPVPYV